MDPYQSRGGGRGGNHYQLRGQYSTHPYPNHPGYHRGRGQNHYDSYPSSRGNLGGKTTALGNPVEEGGVVVPLNPTPVNEPPFEQDESDSIPPQSADGKKLNVGYYLSFDHNQKPVYTLPEDEGKEKDTVEMETKATSKERTENSCSLQIDFLDLDQDIELLGLLNTLPENIREPIYAFLKQLPKG